MNRRRKRMSEEINLTPLLDVLFSILFIVMLTGAQSEQQLQKDAADSQAQISAMENQIEELTASPTKEELEALIAKLEAELDQYLNLSESQQRYETDAVIVTLSNHTENGNHVLKFYVGQDAQLYDSVHMGLDLTEYISNRVSAIVTKIVDASKNRPVYVVFHCDASELYRKEEYIPIRDALEALRETHKEVFYQIVEE